MSNNWNLLDGVERETNQTTYFGAAGDSSVGKRTIFLCKHMRPIPMNGCLRQKCQSPDFAFLGGKSKTHRGLQSSGFAFLERNKANPPSKAPISWFCFFKEESKPLQMCQSPGLAFVKERKKAIPFANLPVLLSFFAKQATVWPTNPPQNRT